MKRNTVPGIKVVLIVFILVSLAIAIRICIPLLARAELHKPLVSKDAIKQTQIIQLSQGDAPVILGFRKEVSGWKLTVDESHYYPVNDRIVDNMLEELSVRRTLYKVGTDKGRPYGIGSERTFSLSLFDSSHKRMTTVYFGDTDVAGNDIYVSYSDNHGVLRTRNAFSFMLTVEASKWIDPFIFFKELKINQIEEIVMVKGNRTRTYRAPHDAQIGRFSAVLESLSCLDITNIPAPPSETITISFGDMHTVLISLAAYNDVWILKNETKGLSYIISDSMKENIDRSLN